MGTTALVFTGRERVEVVPAPAPRPGPLDVVVRATRSLISIGTEGICFGRLFAPGTHWDSWVRYPFSPGYSLVGVVDAVGEEVARARVGDRVAVRAPHAARVLVGPDDDLYRVPGAVSDEDATWFHLATIAQGGVRRAGHRLGDRVAVVGLGPVGQLVVQYVALGGAADVLAVDQSADRVETALAHGATAGVALPIDEAVAELRRATGGAGVDVLYDVTGAAPVFAAALPAVRPFGRVVLLGDTGTPGAQTLAPELLTNGLTVVGAHDMNAEFAASDRDPWSNLAMGELFLRFLADGRMRVADLVSHRFRPEQAAEAYDLVRRRPPGTTGIVFDWTAAP